MTDTNNKLKIYLGKIVLGVVALGLVVSSAPTFAAPKPKHGDLSADHAGLATDHSNLDAKLDAIQAAVDGLSVPAAIFPGDGVDGPFLDYQDNGDGTITDLNTDLMWEQKVAGGGGCTAVLHAGGATCTWADANLDWINAVNAEAYAGYNDWRFPNIRELQSIVDYSIFSPSIDPVFGPSAAAVYWSSTSFANFPSFAWGVFFSNGFVFSADKNNTLRVRAVRGGW